MSSLLLQVLLIQATPREMGQIYFFLYSVSVIKCICSLALPVFLLHVPSPDYRYLFLGFGPEFFIINDFLWFSFYFLLKQKYRPVH